MVIEPNSPSDLDGWADGEGVDLTKGKAVVFKRVSRDWKTREGTENETTWTLGESLEVTNWAPKDQECGPGKFHACSRPYFCDEFRSTKGDRYVAVEVAKCDLHYFVGAQHPHKIAFRRGTVLYECDRMGRKIEVVK